MKKESFVFICASLIAVQGFSQGTIAFNNDQSSLITFRDGTPVPADHWSVQLFWRRGGFSPPIPWDGSLTPQEWYRAHIGWELFGEPTRIGPEPGLFDGGIITLPTTTPGAEILAVVLAFSTENGFEYSSVYNTGVSPFFAVQTGDPTTDPPGAAATLMRGSSGYPGFLGVTIHIPEPSTAALAGVAVLTLFFSRRKRFRSGTN